MAAARNAQRDDGRHTCRGSGQVATRHREAFSGAGASGQRQGRNSKHAAVRREQTQPPSGSSAGSAARTTGCVNAPATVRGEKSASSRINLRHGGDGRH